MRAGERASAIGIERAGIFFARIGNAQSRPRDGIAQIVPACTEGLDGPLRAGIDGSGDDRATLREPGRRAAGELGRVRRRTVPQAVPGQLTARSRRRIGKN
ncbi:MAG: hypothetical protein QOH81_458 [Sphingomonadales bacterium]|jgi:hypothetical protein|nr:hypothetical protein [Sphingomonadales bacterium]